LSTSDPSDLYWCDPPSRHVVPHTRQTGQLTCLFPVECHATTPPVCFHAPSCFCRIKFNPVFLSGFLYDTVPPQTLVCLFFPPVPVCPPATVACWLFVFLLEKIFLHPALYPFYFSPSVVVFHSALLPFGMGRRFRRASTQAGKFLHLLLMNDSYFCRTFCQQLAPSSVFIRFSSCRGLNFDRPRLWSPFRFTVSRGGKSVFCPRLCLFPPPSLPLNPPPIF